jgi:biofilm protein TabA
MILCSIRDFSRYQGLCPRFAAVAEALAQLDVTTLLEGRHELLGDQVFWIGAPRTPTRKEACLEAHRRYIDVQVVLTGVDTMGWAPLGLCHRVQEPYSPDKDIVFYGDPAISRIPVTAGHLAIFFPEDAHAPLLGEGELVDKCVFKILA